MIPPMCWPRETVPIAHRPRRERSGSAGHGPGPAGPEAAGQLSAGGAARPTLVPTLRPDPAPPGKGRPTRCCPVRWRCCPVLPGGAMCTSGRCPACMAVVFVSACVLGGTRAPSGARAPSCQGAGSTGTRLCASIPGDRPATHRAADQPVNKACGSRGLAGTAQGRGRASVCSRDSPPVSLPPGV